MKLRYFTWSQTIDIGEKSRLVKEISKYDLGKWVKTYFFFLIKIGHFDWYKTTDPLETRRFVLQILGFDLGKKVKNGLFSKMLNNKVTVFYLVSNDRSRPDKSFGQGNF